MNGGNDNANAYASLPTAFTDLPTAAWAQGYVRYLQNTGIIAGKSATKVCSERYRNRSRGCKVVLVAAGYNAQKAGLTGAAWAQNTMKYGQLNNLFEDVDTDLNAAPAASVRCTDPVQRTGHGARSLVQRHRGLQASYRR